jgi:NAD(P)-dependent dehydrogenase (short-subunit alcohol dehydrogenase family)
MSAARAPTPADGSVDKIGQPRIAAFGRLDAAYNNAGVQNVLAETADTTREDYDRVMGTLSISGRSSATMASNSVRSLENVFSAPMDPVGSDLTVIDASRNPVVVVARLAEVGLHEF